MLVGPFFEEHHNCFSELNSITTTAQGKLTFHIFGALAEFEQELGRERTMAGLRAAQLPLELSQRPEDVKGKLPLCGRRVDALG